MRSRTLVAAVVAAAALAGSPASGGPATPVAQPSVAQLVGQSIMTGMSGREPSRELLARIRAGEVGGVILFARNIGSPTQVARLIDRLRAAAVGGGNPPLFIAVDQEGGAVRRFPDGPPDRSPAALGLEGSAAETESEGRATAAYLRRLGVDVDLAPVLDTPVSGSSFLGSRAYSKDPRRNAELGTAFVEGLQEGGVAATAKHFPGLGTARISTDTRRVLVLASRRVLEERLLPFTAAIQAGVKLVMVSSAGYLAYDRAGVPAILSRPIVTGLLRDRLGFRGVVISDAMESTALRDRPGVATSAIAAGVNVLLHTNERASEASHAELVAAARNGTLDVSELRRSAARVATLKRWLARTRP